MIDGIEVLTSETVRLTAETDELIIMGIVFVILGIAAFYTFVVCLKEKLGWELALICIASSCLFGLLGGHMFKDALSPTYEERYMVQLKEEVPLDFLKNYEILEDKGNDIYIVREKNSKNSG